MRQMDTELEIVGWREWVRLPNLGIRRIKAKVDTGARSSSLHVFDLEEYVQDGQAFVRFGMHPRQRNTAFTVEASAPIFDKREVKSSTGESTLRHVIRTSVLLLGREIEIDLTLTNRDQMGFRMLLGREAIRNRFLVDSGRSYLGGRPTKSKKRQSRKGTKSKFSIPKKLPSTWNRENPICFFARNS